MGTANGTSSKLAETSISEAHMIRQSVQVTIWFVLFSGLAALAAGADCPSGQCPRPAVRVIVQTPRVGVRVQVGRPVAVRVHGWRPVRPGWLFFPRFE